jgi:histidinol phosphatase-like PHP family hydrolase
MWVDDVLLNFDYILSSIKFIPNYKESFLQYCSQHNITVDHNPHPLELFHNGTWIFTFEKPFWSWYAQQRQRNINVKFNSDEIELYIGIESINKNTNFEKLKKLLDV